MAKEKQQTVSSGMARFNALRPGVNALYSALFILLALICVVPVVFVTVISLSSQASIAKAGYTFTPIEWSGEAYRYVWHLRDYRGFPTVLRAFLNSLGITLVGTGLGLGLISTMGYALSRRTFRLRKAYSIFIFIPMIFNGGLLATYVINAQLLGLKNTYWAVILPLACSSFYIMVMATFFRITVPEAIIESGKIDGAGQARIFLQLVLPISLPALATIALFLTFSYWNDWYQASLYLESHRHDLFPLQYVLVNIERNIQFLANSDMVMSAQTGELPTETMRMAIVVITVVPIMFSYPFFQKYFVSGLTVGAVKG
ncbi:MAG: carbohydrate ABC transporter permease [Clostridia bacterium]|nr:carbohydrate ABC transporter permease [Clostridia bacterium]